MTRPQNDDPRFAYLNDKPKTKRAKQREAAPHSPPIRKLAYSPKEAEAATGLSRCTLWRLVRSGRLSSIKVGTRRLLNASEIEALAGERAAS
jgi:excisionase family DNA binding protein